MTHKRKSTAQDGQNVNGDGRDAMMLLGAFDGWETKALAEVPNQPHPLLVDIMAHVRAQVQKLECLVIHTICILS
jgi:hypothetical protein